jgi:hypothetical protein
MFNLKFPLKDVDKYSKEYKYNENLETKILNEIKPSVQKKGFLTKEEFLTVCEWKSQRIRKQVNKNDERIIKDISLIAFKTSNEQLRIELFTILSGVNFPVASVFLHFFHKEKYPIIDWRALASLGIPRKKNPVYKFDFWNNYVIFCRNISGKSGKNMREVDKALWAFSKHLK